MKWVNWVISWDIAGISWLGTRDQRVCDKVVAETGDIAGIFHGEFSGDFNKNMGNIPSGNRHN